MREKKERYMKKLNSLFFHPKRFFSEVEKEKSYSDILFFYVEIAIFSIILESIFSIILLALKGNLSASNLLDLIISFIIGLGMAFAITFIISFIVHLGVLIFRGKQGYFNTYKPVAYSLAIGVIYGIISIIILGMLGLVIPIEEITDPAQIYVSKGFIISMITYGVIMLISIIHVLYAQVISLSKFQKISRLRAFSSIILIPLIILIILAAILIYAYQNASIPVA